MAEEIKNVSVGRGKLYIGEVGATAPTGTGTLGGDVTVSATDWSTPGFLAKDIELKFNLNVAKFKPRNFTTAIASTVTEKGASGKFNLYEVGIDNLAMALNAVSLDGADIVDGGEGVAVKYHSIIFVSDLAIFHFKKVAMKGDVTAKYGDNDYVDINVDFDCFADIEDETNEPIYRIIKRTAPVTP